MFTRICFMLCFFLFVNTFSLFGLEVWYEKYDFNNVHHEGAAFWSYEDTYLIMEKVKKIFPEEFLEGQPSFVQPALPLSARVSISGDSNQTFTDEKKISELIEPVTKIISVYFPFNSAVLTKDQKRKLEEEVDNFLSEVKKKTEGDVQIVAYITGTACPLGKKTYNKKLSMKRALSIKDVLEKKGIIVKKLEGLGPVKESEILCLNRKAVVFLEAEVSAVSNIKRKEKSVRGD